MYQSNTDPIKVFLVDDHAIVRDGIRAVLNTEPDVEVIGEATNGREAVSKVLSYQPDVTLMDLVMPEMDGQELIKKMRATDKLRDIPVIMMSGKLAEGEVNELLEDGLTYFLPKPVKLDTLNSYLGKLL